MSYPKGWAEEHPLDNSGSDFYRERDVCGPLGSKRTNYVQETANAKQLAISVMLTRFSMDLPENMRDRFNRVIYDIRKDVEQRAMSDYISPVPIVRPTNTNFSIIKSPMKTIEELKNEINELENVHNGLSRDIELLNSKNQNVQAQRDRVTAKIDGLKWVLNSEEK